MFLLAILLYVPPFQNFVVKKAITYASEATGMDIGIDRIRLTFPLNITVNGIEVITQPSDTLVTLGELSVRVNPVPLINKIVSVNDLHLKEARVNTGTFIDGILIKGSFNDLSAQADYIGLSNEEATLNNLALSGAAITVHIDTTSQKQDTTSTPMNWKIKLGKIDLDHICFALQMPVDLLRLSTYIDKAGLNNGLVDLGISRYTVGKFTVSNTVFNYDGDDNNPVAGLDPAHIALSNFNADLASIVYQDKEIKADIRSLSGEERSGLVISSLEGKINSDSITISVPELDLKTPYSSINLTANVPWSVIGDQSDDTLDALLSASIGKEDLFAFIPDLPADFKRTYPNVPLSVTAKADGNLSVLNISELKAQLPNAFSISASGKAGQLMDSIRRSADIDLQVQTQNLNFVLNYLSREQREQFSIPPLRLNGNVGLKNREYQAQLALRESTAKVLVAGRFHSFYETYSASVKIDSLRPIHFMPKDSIMLVTADLQAQGRGFDFFADSTWTSVDAQIMDVQYDSLALSDISLTASLRDHQAKAELISKDSLALINMTVDGTVHENDVRVMLIMDAERIDLYGMHLMDSTFHTSFQVFAEGSSDLKQTNSVDLSLGNWEIVTKQQRYAPKLLTLMARTTPDTSRVSFHAGDLGIVLTGNAGLDTMLNQVTTFSADLSRQLEEDSTLNIASLRPLLPDMTLSVTAGRDNPVYNFLRPYYIGFTQFNILAETSPEEGIRMDAGIYSLYRDTFLIDTVRATIRPDSAGLRYTADVIKRRYRQQTPFNAHVHGSIGTRRVDAELLYTDQNDEVGLLLGVEAVKDTAGFIFHLFPQEPILAFNKFTLNQDNYFRFRNMKDIDANIRLTGNQNASLWLHSVPTGETYPELHVELSQFNLDTITTGFPQLPKMKGILSADIRYAPTEESLLLVADLNVDTLFYENGRIGQMLLNAVYLPLDNSQHQVDVHIHQDQSEIASATALYRANAENNIDGQLDITTLPLSIASAFTGGAAELNGALNGNMAISGSTSTPRLNGFIQLDTASVYLGMADTRLQFEEKRIDVKNSLVTFDKYQILSKGNNPFVIDGNINISDFSRMMADLRLTANNMQVLDARRTSESLVYGKLFVNLSSTVKGPMNALAVRGDLQVLGGTDATYVMTESALTVQDRLKDLVTFTSFTDTLTRMRRPQNALPLGGMDMLMVIHIDPAVQLRVDLTPDQSNYAEITGGGDLSFQYTPQGDMVLNGRYTFSEGNINYSLPVIPLKEFRIHEDSYVQWDGEVMNPLLSVQATERMRVSAKTSGESAARMVNFDVGINVQNRLEDLALDFTISAPEDMPIENELAAMGAEERSKQAVAMMVTGTYMYGGGTGGGMNLSATDALNSFLNSEINNIAGDALKTVDISFGMDTYDDPSGAQRRDFSFQFSKRFYNDRIRVMIGGKVSTGEDVNQTEPFLDNVSVEYRLDQAGTKNIKAFHDVTFDNLLEGQVRETGAGIVFRKKVRRLKEIFDFRKKRVATVIDEPEEEEENNEKETNEQPNEQKAVENEQTSGNE